MSNEVTVVVETNEVVTTVNEGIPGVGVPPGGTAGQILEKASNTNFDTTWVTSEAFTAIVSLTGDVSATGPGAAAATVNAVGGKTASAIATVVTNTTGVNSGDDSIGTANGLSLAAHVLSLQLATDSVPGALSADDHASFNAKVSTARAINTTAPITGGGNLSADRTLALTTGNLSTSTAGVTVGTGSNRLAGGNATVDIQTATDSVPGLLSAADHTAFNAKQAAGNYITGLTGDVTASGPGNVAATVASVGGNTASAIATVVNNTTGTNTGDATIGTANGLSLSGQALSLQTATNSVPGAMSAADHTSLSTLAANTTGVNSGNVSIGTANGLSLAGQALSLQAATDAVPGALTAADHAAFNAKQAAGNYVTALTGDVTASGPGSAVATVASVGGKTASAIATVVNNTTGTNSGDASLSAIGSSPNANAATLTGQVLNLQPASASFGGVLTSGVQSIAGAKTFTGAISASNLSGTNTGDQPAFGTISTITSNTSAATNNTYLCDTSGGAFNLTLPAPTSGNWVGVIDKTGSFGTNSLTLVRNASEKIQGISASYIYYGPWIANLWVADGTDWRLS